MQRQKIEIALVFGGMSEEHEISIQSAESILANLNRDRYVVHLLYITKEGEWKYFKDDVVSSRLHSALSRGSKLSIRLSNHPSLQVERESGEMVPLNLDVAFPVLHGPYGEDGRIQGMFDTMKLPYIGSGVIASAIGMDKIVQKKLLRADSIPTVDFRFLSKDMDFEQRQELLDKIGSSLGFPCFVKPANLGSSVGITKVKEGDYLVEAIETALSFSESVIIERAVEPVREFECGLLERGDNLIPSEVGEVIASNEFYDYASKYLDGKSQCKIPATIDTSIHRNIIDLSIKAFRSLGCRGYARADFLQDQKTGEVYFSEMNTIPGFTSISMYPRLFEAIGIPYDELLNILIENSLK